MLRMLSWGAYRGNPRQMSKPPQLAPFSAGEQQFYPEILPDVKPWAQTPFWEFSFLLFVSPSWSFGHYPHLMAIAGGRNIDWPVSYQLLLLSQRCLHCDWLVQSLHHCRYSSHQSPAPFFPHLNKIMRYLNSCSWGNNSSPNRSEQFTLFCLKTMVSPLEVLILIPTASYIAANSSVQAGGHSLMTPTGPYHLQLCNQTRYPPPLGCA